MTAQSPRCEEEFLRFADFPILYLIQKIIFRCQINTDVFMWCHNFHNDVIKWKHFPRDWPFGRGIHRSPVNSPHKGQWRGALMFSFICAWINAWVNNRDLRRHRVHYDVTVMFKTLSTNVTGISGQSPFPQYHDNHFLRIEFILPFGTMSI